MTKNAETAENTIQTVFDPSFFFTLCSGGGVLMIMHAIVIRPLTSHPYKAGTEHAGFSPDQARTQSPSAKRRGVFGESHEG